MARRRPLSLALVGLVVASAAFVVSSPPEPAGALPTGFQQSVVLRGLNKPVNMEFAPDGRIFIAERAGIIKVFDGLDDTTPSTFVDIRAEVFSNDGRGMLGLALDPDWSNTPFVYALYTLDGPIGSTPPVYGAAGDNEDNCPASGLAGECVVGGRLVRFPAATNTAGPEQVLIEGWCQQYTTHSIGDLAFGGDGALYVSSGDGAFAGQPDYGQRGLTPNVCGDPPTAAGVAPTLPSAEGGALRSQDVRTTGDPTTLVGAVARVDPDTGAGLPDNPLASSTDPNARRIVSFGHRNPFRLTNRPGTDEIWVGDVGWNTWEEVNRIADPTPVAPYNHGWPCYEGTSRGYDLGLTLCETLYAQGAGAVRAPYFQYRQNYPAYTGDTCDSGSSSVSGLAFYQGGPYPAAYDGALFVADYARDCVWVMFAGANGLPDPSNIALMHCCETIVDLEIGPNGDLFMLDMFGGVGGNVIRVSYPGGETGPNAVVSANPTSGAVPLPVRFDGSASTSPRSGGLTYAWDLDGDGAYDDGTGATINHTYTTAGIVTARLRVTDTSGAIDTASVQITAGSAPVPVIDAPTALTKWKAGDHVAFHGSATDEGVALPASALTWNVVLKHCHTLNDCHDHPLGGSEGVDHGEVIAPDHEYPAFLELQLTARDASGLTGTTSVTLAPETVDVTIESVPSGLAASISGYTANTPFTRREIVGAQHTIGVASPQTRAGRTYDFGSWSDGGLRVHDVVLGSSNLTYTATFAESAGPRPVAAFGFDEASGAVALDATGNGHAGAVAGATRTATGRFGRALVFDGVNDSVEIPYDEALAGSTGFTLEAWVMPANATGPRAVLVRERRTGVAFSMHARHATNRPRGFAAVAKTSGQAIGPAKLAVGVWSHVAVTWDAKVLRLYVNGAAVSSTTLKGTIKTGTGLLRIGGNKFAAEWFKGSIDEVRIYDQALTQAQVAADRTTPVN